MKHFCVYANLPSSATVHPLARSCGQEPVSQSDSGVGTTAGGWPGLGARVELGDWFGSRVLDRKTINDEAGGSQTMKRVVVWLRPSKRPFLRPQSNSRPRCPHKR